MKSPFPGGQRGGFLIGMVIGLLIGLAVALGVALYVTKAPVPFVNKVPVRPPGQEAAEAERNRNWDPNSPLAGKNPAPIPACLADSWNSFSASRSSSRISRDICDDS